MPISSTPVALSASPGKVAIGCDRSDDALPGVRGVKFPESTPTEPTMILTGCKSVRSNRYLAPNSFASSNQSSCVPSPVHESLSHVLEHKRAGFRTCSSVFWPDLRQRGLRCNTSDGYQTPHDRPILSTSPIRFFHSARMTYALHCCFVYDLVIGAMTKATTTRADHKCRIPQCSVFEPEPRRNWQRG
jgi:hypothetical protein